MVKAGKAMALAAITGQEEEEEEEDKTLPALTTAVQAAVQAARGRIP
jgi:hypothetical protein